MTRFTDLFIRRPVLATVVSLLIFFVGLKCIFTLSLREYPKLNKTTITITTSFPGASADLVESFVTGMIEQGVASADGIDYLTSSSSEGQSKVNAHVKLNYDSEKAFTDVMSKLSGVRRNLPRASEEPNVVKSTGSPFALMYLSYSSSKMTPEQITDYITRVVQPKLETIGGVSQAQVFGGFTFAVRIWLNPDKMAAFGVNASDVSDALARNNFIATTGTTKADYITIPLSAKTNATSIDTFKSMVIRAASDGGIVRMSDVARVELGSEFYDASVNFNGKDAVFIGITATPSANPLDVITRVKQELPTFEEGFPSSLKQRIVYDATRFIRSSIREVITTIVEAVLIVIFVIYLFLGSFRTVVIPVVTIPLSLVGVAIFMLALGYSLNLLTLLAMVLAVGLVVDDAIVVVENIYRHIEGGMKPVAAALQGAREIAMPVISMTITLAAVYAPIGFMGGVTGSYFTQFAFTLAGTVIISGIVALTLSPMMCSKLLNSDLDKNRFVHFINHLFEAIRRGYERKLSHFLEYKKTMAVFAGLILFSCYFLYTHTASELAPMEDQGMVFIMASGPQYANINYTSTYTKEMNRMLLAQPSRDAVFLINGSEGVNAAVAGLILKPWDERSQSEKEVVAAVNKELASIAGLRVQAVAIPPLYTGGNIMPIDIAITSLGSYEDLYHVADTIKQEAMKTGAFMFLSSHLKFNKPEVTFNIDRSKAALLGLSMQDIGAQLATALSGSHVNRFSMYNRSYKVIPQLDGSYRTTAEKVSHMYVKTKDGSFVPLSTVVSINKHVNPNSLNHFQQMKSTRLQGMPMIGVSMGAALKKIQSIAASSLKNGMGLGYAGQSRTLVSEGSALMVTLFFSVLVIFLVLSAQFESFRDPLIILISVPMSICGALIPLNLGMASVNIYTQIGLITLVGLISKHGILIVEFANKLQEEQGMSKLNAVIESAGTRLRPIIMTTAAMVLGVLPLILAEGAGAASRYNIGLVIAAGMLIGTCFTLFVLPTIYLLLASDKSKRTE